MSAWKVKSDPCPPMTLVSTAASQVRLICGSRRGAIRLSSTPPSYPSDTAPKRQCSIGVSGGRRRETRKIPGLCRNYIGRRTEAKIPLEKLRLCCVPAAV
jgi:hypothetical protein